MFHIRQILSFEVLPENASECILGPQTKYYKMKNNWCIYSSFFNSGVQKNNYMNNWVRKLNYRLSFYGHIPGIKKWLKISLAEMG